MLTEAIFENNKVEAPYLSKMDDNWDNSNPMESVQSSKKPVNGSPKSTADIGAFQRYLVGHHRSSFYTTSQQ